MNETTKNLGISYFLGITAIIFIFIVGIIFAITKNSPSQNSTETNQNSIQSSSESELSSPVNNSENATQDQENLSM